MPEGDDDADDRSDDELRALIDEAETGGSETDWDPAAAKREVLRRYKERAK